MQHPGFFETVQEAWLIPVQGRDSATKLNGRLRNVRRALKHWSRQLSKLSKTIENCQQVLLELDSFEELRALSVSERNFRKILKRHIVRLQDYQNKYWHKRCTVRWIQFGDENSSFFHRMATERHRRNAVASLTLEDGSLVEDHDGKAAALFQSVY